MSIFRKIVDNFKLKYFRVLSDVNLRKYVKRNNNFQKFLAYYIFIIILSLFNLIILISQKESQNNPKSILNKGRFDLNEFKFENQNRTSNIFSVRSISEKDYVDRNKIHLNFYKNKEKLSKKIRINFEFFNNFTDNLYDLKKTTLRNLQLNSYNLSDISSAIPSNDSTKLNNFKNQFIQIIDNIVFIEGSLILFQILLLISFISFHFVKIRFENLIYKLVSFCCSFNNFLQFQVLAEISTKIIISDFHSRFTIPYLHSAVTIFFTIFIDSDILTNILSCVLSNSLIFFFSIGYSWICDSKFFIPAGLLIAFCYFTFKVEIDKRNLFLIDENNKNNLKNLMNTLENLNSGIIVYRKDDYFEYNKKFIEIFKMNLDIINKDFHKDYIRVVLFTHLTDFNSNLNKDFIKRIKKFNTRFIEYEKMLMDLFFTNEELKNIDLSIVNDKFDQDDNNLDILNKDENTINIQNNIKLINVNDGNTSPVNKFDNVILRNNTGFLVKKYSKMNIFESNSNIENGQTKKEKEDIKEKTMEIDGSYNNLLDIQINGNNNLNINQNQNKLCYTNVNFLKSGDIKELIRQKSKSFNNSNLNTSFFNPICNVINDSNQNENKMLIDQKQDHDLKKNAPLKIIKKNSDLKYKHTQKSLYNRLKEDDLKASKISQKVILNEKINTLKEKIKGFVSDFDGFKTIFFNHTNSSKYIYMAAKKYTIENEEFIYRIYCRYNDLSDSLEFLIDDLSSFFQMEDMKSQFKYKKYFLDKFSHEFRNPILNIKQLVKNVKMLHLNYRKELEDLINWKNTCIDNDKNVNKLKINKQGICFNEKNLDENKLFFSNKIHDKPSFIRNSIITCNNQICNIAEENKSCKSVDLKSNRHSGFLNTDKISLNKVNPDASKSLSKFKDNESKKGTLISNKNKNKHKNNRNTVIIKNSGLFIEKNLFYTKNNNNIIINNINTNINNNKLISSENIADNLNKEINFDIFNNDKKFEKNFAETNIDLLKINKIQSIKDSFFIYNNDFKEKIEYVKTNKINKINTNSEEIIGDLRHIKNLCEYMSMLISDFDYVSNNNNSLSNNRTLKSKQSNNNLISYPNFSSNQSNQSNNILKYQEINHYSLRRNMSNLRTHTDNIKNSNRYSILNNNANNPALNSSNKITRNETILEKTTFNISKFLKYFIKIFESKIFLSDKKIFLEYSIAPKVPEKITHDISKIRLIIFNLLCNSVKFTSNGIIKIEVDTDNQNLLINIIDSGIGIKADNLIRLLKPIKMVKIVENNFNGGMGMGLYVTRRYIELLGGSFSIESLYGVGTLIEIKIPFYISRMTTNYTLLVNEKLAVDNQYSSNQMQSPIRKNSRYKPLKYRSYKPQLNKKIKEKFEINSVLYDKAFTGLNNNQINKQNNKIKDINKNATIHNRTNYKSNNFKNNIEQPNTELYNTNIYRPFMNEDLKVTNINNNLPSPGSLIGKNTLINEAKTLIVTERNFRYNYNEVSCPSENNSPSNSQVCFSQDDLQAVHQIERSNANNSSNNLNSADKGNFLQNKYSKSTNSNFSIIYKLSKNNLNHIISNLPNNSNSGSGLNNGNNTPGNSDNVNDYKNNKSYSITSNNNIDKNSKKAKMTKFSQQNLNNFASFNNSLRILIVDDERLIRQSERNVIDKYFKQKGINYIIEECADGVECLHKIYEGLKNGIKYDMIITDETMNFMKGSTMAEILRLLMKDNIMYFLKIVMVTSYEISNISPSIKVNLDKIFTKPLSKNNLDNIFSMEK